MTPIIHLENDPDIHVYVEPTPDGLVSINGRKNKKVCFAVQGLTFQQLDTIRAAANNLFAMLKLAAMNPIDQNPDPNERQ